MYMYMFEWNWKIMESFLASLKPLRDILFLLAVMRVCFGEQLDPRRMDMIRRHSDLLEEDENEPDPNFFYLDVFMPGVLPQNSEQYVCTSVLVPRQDSYIVGFEPHANMNTAHHMLLYGCGDVQVSPGLSYDCVRMGSCRGKGNILFAWARNASQPTIPTGVGFHIGGSSGIKYLTLQIHYGDITHLKDRDYSGLSAYVTLNPQPYAGGVYLLGSGYMSIPPQATNFHADIACIYSDLVPIYPFAFRTHAHELSSVITGYRIRQSEWTLLGKGNPKWAQAFYPMDHVYEIRSGDILAARCTYNSQSRQTITHAGGSSHDEMCNFYMMYYTDALEGETYKTCWDEGNPQLFQNIPPGADIPPKNPPSMSTGTRKMEPGHNDPSPDFYEYNIGNGNYKPDFYGANINDNDHNFEKYGGQQIHAAEENVDQTTSRPVIGKTSGQEFGATKKVQTDGNDKNNAKDNKKESSEDLTIVEGWPTDNGLTLGQVAGVAVDSDGDVHIFQRADRIWGVRTFSADNRFLNADKGRIKNSTVLVFDKATGKIKHQWGENLFFMPHGLSIDSEGNMWLTDVALHQVFKFPPGGGDKPLLSLGTELQPGSGTDHFCKPTDVAVDVMTGDIFVADGYCNSRIVKFSAGGDYILEWGKASSYVGRELSIDPEPSTFSIPHSLTFVPSRQQLCVADRENGRIQCFEADSGKYVREYNLPEFGQRLFAISYSPWKGGVLYAINGKVSSTKGATNQMVQGFTIGFDSGVLLHMWMPGNSGFKQPHDVAAAPDSRDVYVVEIGPNRVWKFQRDLGLDETAYSQVEDKRQPHINDAPKQTRNSSLNASITTTAIIVAVLAVPIFLMLLVAVSVRLRAQGRMRFFQGEAGTAIRSSYKATSDNKFSLGNFFNRRKGFNQVDTEESDPEGGMGWSDDSDVEEYSILNSKRTQNL
ncbi:peptidyl-glycine alpha-amidating monooxygenase-like [Acanthaster planci]|uniref:Peptidyl-glycine alpha-amidating monooxygenase-like n=1 Tax=Acanthaster planci TaxID=133434 RepID=A0A8B7ZLX3_ACAPL|nr:peptidyl-glycine alpha-amidating monooxygenase-like [Acanthaster planci]